MNLKGILWDNDGVLVETERLYFQANRKVLLPYQLEMTESDYFNFYLINNCGAWHLVREQGVSEEEILSIRKKRDDLYVQSLLTSSDLVVPGVESLLKNLNGRVKMGVVTSSYRDYFNAIHHKLNLMRYFEFAITNEDYEESKPSPEPYLLGLQKLDIPKEECLIIEDSPRGLQSALAAGIRCMVIRTELMRDYPFEGAYRIVESVEALGREIEASL